MRVGALGAFVVAAALLEGSAAAAALRPRMIGASPDTAHEAVVALVDDGGRTVCSGTLIAPRAVLTAAHCLAFDASEAPPFRRACVGSSADRCLQSVAVVSSVRHPEYRPGTFHHDLAVVTLEEDVHTRPVVRASQPPAVGTSVVLVGFGRTDASDGSTTGERRARTVTVLSRDDDRIRYGESTCTGDSGGAAFLSGELVAVTSSGPADCRDSGDSQLIILERAFIDRAAGLDDSAAPGCAVGACPLPAPAPFSAVLLLLLTVLAVLAVRRARTARGRAQSSVTAQCRASEGRARYDAAAAAVTGEAMPRERVMPASSSTAATSETISIAAMR